VRRFLAIFAPLAGLFVLSWCQTFFSAAAVVPLAACQNGDAGGIEPLTGVEVLASSLVAGHGCGTGSDQIYKYVVIAQIPLTAGIPQLDGLFMAGGVYDCFANATLNDLCTYPCGTVNAGANSTAYAVTVYAFTAAQWNGSIADAGGAPTVGATVTNAFPVDQTFAGFGSFCTSNCGTPPVALNPLVVVPAIEQQMSVIQSYAGWKTTCSAIEQVDVPVFASCPPLTPLQP